MKIYFYFLLLAVLNSGCSESPQQALMDKKWYFSKLGYIEFTSDKTYKVYYEGESTSKCDYELIVDDKFRISDPKSGDTMEYIFNVKGDILFILRAEDSLREGTSYDTTFYHLNPEYESWEARELYYFGKVISEKDPRALPYI